MAQKGIVTRYFVNIARSGSPTSSRIYAQSTLIGADIGTAAGGIVGAIAGQTGNGLVAGAVVGTVG